MRFALVLIVAAASLLAQDPVASRDWLNRGVTAYKNGRYQDAVAAFTKAVEVDPSFVAGHLYLGTAYMRMYIPGAESPENQAVAANAHTEFQKVLALDANNRMALLSEPSLYLNQKQWDLARQGFEKVTAIDPNNADAYYSLGFIAWSKWYPEYARARAQSGLKQQDPGPIPNPAIRQDLKARFDTVIDEGESALNKALALRPDYSDAMAYMNLLIRERADLRDTAAECLSDVAVADDWVRKALDAKRAQAARRSNSDGIAPPPPPPVPPPPPPSGGGGGGGDRMMAVSAEAAATKLLTKVDPVYPPLAVQAHVSGVVTLIAVIGTDGRVRNLEVIGGHPLLVAAALDAVKQWVYQPTLLNGEPVEVRTTISLSFGSPQ
jgi:TonB family protein